MYSNEQIELFETDPMTFNNHNDFVTVEDFYKNPRLSSEFKILSTSTSKNHTIEFISSIEGVRYPFYAVQFHPEKSEYDFNPNHPSNHYKASIMAMQVFPVFFLNEAIKNHHVFRDDQEKHSVYNAEIGFDSNIGPIYLYP